MFWDTSFEQSAHRHYQCKKCSAIFGFPVYCCGEFAERQPKALDISFDAWVV